MNPHIMGFFKLFPKCDSELQEIGNEKNYDPLKLFCPIYHLIQLIFFNHPIQSTRSNFVKWTNHNCTIFTSSSNKSRPSSKTATSTSKKSRPSSKTVISSSKNSRASSKTVTSSLIKSRASSKTLTSSSKNSRASSKTVTSSSKKSRASSKTVTSSSKKSRASSKFSY